MPFPLTSEQLKQRREQLPQRLQEIYSSIETTDILREIGREQGLNIYQIGELVDETGLVMLGVTPPNTYVANIAERTETDRATAKNIAAAVNERLFERVRDELKHMHGLGGGAQSAQEKVAFGSPSEKPAGVPENIPTGKQGENEEVDDSTEEGEVLDREELLREIESPEQTNQKKAGDEPQQAAPEAVPEEVEEEEVEIPARQERTMAEEKLNQSVSLPREESTYMTEPREEKQPTETQKRPPEQDPYREPVE